MTWIVLKHAKGADFTAEGWLMRRQLRYKLLKREGKVQGEIH
jgi:hypothetical protein